ncbi:sulfite exporter TauE/SafE family protein [candidate division WOR-3 bacterium]|nr:sulfite exporter TauE/SafE family protein [candidate division WOR-3 bacterium]MCK4527301.1 sulfite exporter TauE/SafE family protein [candidate division WOR-3 bacterium]
MAGFTMGWGPCLAYTAPLLLPYIGATKRNWQDGLKVGLVFSMGRLLALAILGGLATVIFSFINRFFPPQKSGWLYLIVAFFMIIMGILIILDKGFKVHIGKSILDKGDKSMFLFGFLMGIAPCVPYVAILTYIACVAENSILVGVLYAALFAIGTAIAPVVLGTVMGIIPGKLFRSAKWLRVFRVVCGIILILFGLQLIFFWIQM